MNNPKLKLAMVKLLPEKLGTKPYNFVNGSWEYPCWLEENRVVLKTEWLYVMHLVRKDLTQEQKVKYLNFLRDHISKTTGTRTVSDFDLLDADFESQAEAMCKVKGITIP